MKGSVREEERGWLGALVRFRVSGLLSGGRKRASRSFNWAYSLDGKVWVAVPSTPYATTTITGLTPLTTYEFRVSLTDKNGEGPWSQALSFLVH